MKVLFQETRARYTSDNANAVSLRDIVNGLFLGKAPKSAAHPFITLSLVSGSAIYATGSGGASIPIVNQRIQFSTWDNTDSPTRIVEASEYLRPLFDFYCITVTNFGTLQYDRVFENLLEDPDEGFQGVLQYDVTST